MLPSTKLTERAAVPESIWATEQTGSSERVDGVTPLKFERATNSQQASRRANSEHLLTPAELARYLQVPLTTIYRWRSRGEGPPGMRLGRHVRFRLGDVEQWLDHRRDSA